MRPEGFEGAEAPQQKGALSALVIQQKNKAKALISVVRPEGFEPPTVCLRGNCSTN